VSERAAIGIDGDGDGFRNVSNDAMAALDTNVREHLPHDVCSFPDKNGPSREE